MATVTGFTAERMKSIEDRAINAEALAAESDKNSVQAVEDAANAVRESTEANQNSDAAKKAAESALESAIEATDRATASAFSALAAQESAEQAEASAKHAEEIADKDWTGPAGTIDSMTVEEIPGNTPEVELGGSPEHRTIALRIPESIQMQDLLDYFQQLRDEVHQIVESWEPIVWPVGSVYWSVEPNEYPGDTFPGIWENNFNVKIGEVLYYLWVMTESTTPESKLLQAQSSIDQNGRGL